ncbi:MAG: helix-turn-helix domain-containing protein [Microbacterium sp.]
MPTSTSPAAPPASPATWKGDLAGFRAAVNDSFVPLRLSSDHPDRFRGALRRAAIDGIQITELRATDHVVERTPELIARTTHNSYKVSVMLAGTGLLIQDGREAVLGPGDFAVYDINRPYTLAFDDDFRTVVLMFAHDALDLPPAALSQLTAVRVAGDTGLGGAVSPYLGGLGAHLDELTGACGGRLARTALDLLTTVFTHELGLDGAATDPRRALRERIRGYIEEHLGSADLNPTTIAAAHYISTRHLHGVFHDDGTTVSTFIRMRRLERCRRDLRDPLLADRAVATIGMRWGFPDAAHFSRTFKSSYGISPSEFRSGR